MKKTYYKPQIKVFIPKLENFMGNNTNQEQTHENFGGDEETDWHGGNSKSFNVWESEI